MVTPKAISLTVYDRLFARMGWGRSAKVSLLGEGIQGAKSRPTNSEKGTANVAHNLNHTRHFQTQTCVYPFSCLGLHHCRYWQNSQSARSKDWHDSVLHILNSARNRIAVRGAILIDDYGDWSGCKTAVDNFLAKYGHDFDVQNHAGALVLIKK